MKFELKSLECNIVHHCINQCANCSHLSPVNEPFFVEPSVFKRDLENIAKIATSPRFSLLGGEPLLHPKLLELIDIAKASGISNTICVTTNGQLIEQVSEEFWKKIDQIIISWYPGKLRGRQVEYARQKFFQYKNHELKEKDFIVQTINKFYIPISRNELSVEQTCELFNFCHWRDHCTTIDNGYFYLCPQAKFFPKFFFNELNPVDGLILEGITYEKLKDFFYRKDPFLSCKKCAYGTWTHWREVPKKDWLETSVI